MVSDRISAARGAHASSASARAQRAPRLLQLCIELDCSLRVRARYPGYPSVGSTRGRYIFTVVPRPGALDTSRAPFDCRTIPSTVESPSPVPLPALLVGGQ